MTYTEKMEKVYKAFLIDNTMKLPYKEYGFLVSLSGVYDNELKYDEKKRIDKIYNKHFGEVNEAK